MSPRNVYKRKNDDSWKMSMYLKNPETNNIWDDMSSKDVYKREKIDSWKMSMYCINPRKNNIWDDMLGETSSKFADKYFGKSLMNTVRKSTTDGYEYIITLTEELLTSYSNVDENLEGLQQLEMIEVVRKVMKIGDRFGFKDVVVNQILESSFIHPGKSKVTDKLFPLGSYMEVLSTLPNRWSQMKQHFCSLDGGVNIYETLICKLILITVQCIVDCVRMNCTFKVDKERTLEYRRLSSTLVLKNQVADNLELTTTDGISEDHNLLSSRDCLCRNENIESVFSIMLQNAPTCLMLFDEVPPLREVVIDFLDNYVMTITLRLRQFIESGEFRYHVERILQIEPGKKCKNSSRLSPQSDIHVDLVEIMILVAERILNVEGFPLFGKQWEPFISKLTRTTSPHLLTSMDFEMAPEYFNQTCCEKLSELLKDHPDAESLELHLRVRLTRFVFWFCASVVRFSTIVHVSKDNTVCNVMYNRVFEIVCENEQEWESQSANHQDEDRKPNSQFSPMENVEVTDEELDAARSIRAPSTSSGHSSAMINPEFIEFYRRVENDGKLSDEWKEMVRTMLFSNYQLLKEYERVEKRFDRLCDM